MIQPFNSEFLTPTKRFRRFSVLLAIHNGPKISQHRIAQITHMSSSMVNNYMKDLKGEGRIETTGRTNRTQSYHLTPLGKKELISSLVAYSTEIIQFYGGAKRELAKRLAQVAADGVSTIVLFGAAETAEVVHAALKEVPLRIVGIIDSDRRKQNTRFNGLRIEPPEVLKEMKADAVVITSFGKQEEIYDLIRSTIGSDVKVIKLTDL